MNISGREQLRQITDPKRLTMRQIAQPGRIRGGECSEKEKGAANTSAAPNRAKDLSIFFLKLALHQILEQRLHALRQHFLQLRLKLFQDLAHHVVHVRRAVRSFAE
jgi:hypothetical protein